MNQILSVELPKKKSKLRTQGGQSNKASTKSVVIFFSIVLLLFGIALIGISLYSMLGKPKTTVSNTQSSLPRIDVTQNATELEVEISCTNEIASIEYKWEEQEPQKVDISGKNSTELKVNIPSGTNIFTIKVIDVDNNTNEFSKEYVGAKEPNITMLEPKFESKTGKNKIPVVCEENQVINYISYSYDQGEEKKQEINNTTAKIEIEELEGEHELTFKVGYQDGTVGRISKTIYAPNVMISTDAGYTKFIINASDSRTIEKVSINFNGSKIEEVVNKESYTKELQLIPGEPGTNKLLVIVYNKDGMSLTKKVWDITRKN